jgi:hypothetical protein
LGRSSLVSAFPFVWPSILRSDTLLALVLMPSTSGFPRPDTSSRIVVRAQILHCPFCPGTNLMRPEHLAAGGLSVTNENLAATKPMPSSKRVTREDLGMMLKFVGRRRLESSVHVSMMLCALENVLWVPVRARRSLHSASSIRCLGFSELRYCTHMLATSA